MKIKKSEFFNIYREKKKSQHYFLLKMAENGMKEKDDLFKKVTNIWEEIYFYNYFF